MANGEQKEKEKKKTGMERQQHTCVFPVLFRPVESPSRLPLLLCLGAAVTGLLRRDVFWNPHLAEQAKRGAVLQSDLEVESNSALLPRKKNVYVFYMRVSPHFFNHGMVLCHYLIGETNVILFCFTRN